MLAEFLNIFFKSLKLDKSLYRDNRYFGEAAIYFAGLIRFFAVTPELVIPVIFLTQFWIFASLIISTKQVLNIKSNFKSFGIIFLSFLIIVFLSVSFVMSRMSALPVGNSV